VITYAAVSVPKVIADCQITLFPATDSWICVLVSVYRPESQRGHV